jgi:hypothetical protein
MQLFINAYDREGVPLADLSTKGWSGARRDVSSATEARSVIAQHVVTTMKLYMLVNLPPAEVVPVAVAVAAEAHRAKSPLRIAVQIGNEWDLNFSPFEACDAWSRVASETSGMDVTLVTAGISSLSDAALNWLREALPRPPWWQDLVCGFHGYNGNQPINPTTRRSELSKVRSVVGARMAWNTETGWHQASTKKDFPLCWQKKPGLTEDQVLGNLSSDVALHREAGIPIYTVYQLNDGPSDTPAHRSGIRAYDGRWKRQAYLPSWVAARGEQRRV